MQPTERPEHDTADQEARLAAEGGTARLLTPRCTTCGRDLALGVQMCPEHPGAVVRHILGYEGLARPTHPDGRLASHLDGDGHKRADSTIMTFLVITLGMAMAITLAALHLAGGW